MTERTIEAVIFDLGRVLVAIDNQAMVKELFSHIGTDDPQLAAKTMKSSHMIDLCSGRIDLEEFHRRMSAAYNSDLGFAEFKDLWCSIFYTMEGAEELLRELDGTVTLGLLSDTDAVHWNYIKNRWPWLEMIPRPTLSYAVGLIKPDPAIYLKAAANAETQPEKCLFIDDLEANVEGARAVGMTAVQFKNIALLRHFLRSCGLL
ncbi:MAG: HAD-IA family hydrolase [Planctomycetota bacterium]|jgi:putative hydrolase of the HAD superfamily